MVGYDYSKPLKTADRLIKRFGTTAFIVYAPTATGDGWRPTVGSSTEVACSVVFDEYSVSERSSSLIEINDRKALVSAVGITIDPSQSCSLRVPGDGIYSVVRVTPIKPGATVVMYELQVRR